MDNTILLVEDNDDDIDLTIRAFAKNKIMNSIVVAKDGAKAIQLLHEQHLRPQLVILDLNLPKLNGHEVLERIRAVEETRLVPVVVLTSSAQDEDLVRSYGCGANSYVRKPVDFEEFIRAVGTLGLYWLVLNLGPPASATS